MSELTDIGTAQLVDKWFLSKPDIEEEINIQARHEFVEEQPFYEEWTIAIVDELGELANGFRCGTVAQDECNVLGTAGRCTWRRSIVPFIGRGQCIPIEQEWADAALLIGEWSISEQNTNIIRPFAGYVADLAERLSTEKSGFKNDLFILPGSDELPDATVDQQALMFDFFFELYNTPNDAYIWTVFQNVPNLVSSMCLAFINSAWPFQARRQKLLELAQVQELSIVDLPITERVWSSQIGRRARVERQEQRDRQEEEKRSINWNFLLRSGALLAASAILAPTGAAAARLPPIGGGGGGGGRFVLPPITEFEPQVENISVGPGAFPIVPAQTSFPPPQIITTTTTTAAQPSALQVTRLPRISSPYAAGYGYFSDINLQIANLPQFAITDLQWFKEQPMAIPRPGESTQQTLYRAVDEFQDELGLAYANIQTYVGRISESIAKELPYQTDLTKLVKVLTRQIEADLAIASAQRAISSINYLTSYSYPWRGIEVPERLIKQLQNALKEIRDGTESISITRDISATIKNWGREYNVLRDFGDSAINAYVSGPIEQIYREYDLAGGRWDALKVLQNAQAAYALQVAVQVDKQLHETLMPELNKRPPPTPVTGISETVQNIEIEQEVGSLVDIIKRTEVKRSATAKIRDDIIKQFYNHQDLLNGAEFWKWCEWIDANINVELQTNAANAIARLFLRNVSNLIATMKDAFRLSGRDSDGWINWLSNKLMTFVVGATTLGVLYIVVPRLLSYVLRPREQTQQQQPGGTYRDTLAPRRPSFVLTAPPPSIISRIGSAVSRGTRQPEEEKQASIRSCDAAIVRLVRHLSPIGIQQLSASLRINGTDLAIGNCGPNSAAYYPYICDVLQRVLSTHTKYWAPEQLQSRVTREGRVTKALTIEQLVLYHTRAFNC
jgi:hypothetical protein